MHKGIGAAPFAIVAALIIALAAGLWATQAAQAQDAGDLTLTFATDVAGTETGAGVDSTAAAAGIAFRGPTDRGSKVLVTTDVATPTGSYPLEITVTGPASLKASATLTTGTCTFVTATACTFDVHTTGDAGEFSVRGAAATGNLTDANINDPKTIKGQWVGPAVTVTVLKGAPANSAVNLDADSSDTTPDVKIATLFGSVSPSAVLGNFTAGLVADGDDSAEGNQPETGFLFQLTDSAGQAALALAADDRAAPRVRIITDSADEDVTLEFVAGTLSIPDTETNQLSEDGKTVYAQIGNESTLLAGTGYPALDAPRVLADPPTGKFRAGGLIAVALDGESVDLGDAALGRIVIDLPGGETIEHAIAVAGNPDADMSTVSAAGSPAHLGLGDGHKRTVSLRDANGTPVPGSAGVIVVAETKADPRDLYFADVAAKSGSPGDYTLTIWANEEQSDDIPDSTDTADEDESEVKGGIPDAGSRDAALGVHAFTVRINKLGSTTQVVKKTADADGNPLEAHIAGGITGLTVVGVTRGGDEVAIEDGAVQVPPFSTLQITVQAIGKDGLAPQNGSEVTPRDGTGGFAGGGTTGYVGKTNDAGEVTVTYGAGTVTQRVSFTGAGGSAVAALLVRVVDPDAPVDTGPVLYSLVDSASSTFVTWQGGDVASSVFENVADLVRVWKWTGTMWVGYNSNPAAPAGTKTNFTLSNNDIIYVVSNGPVSLSLG